MNRDGFDTDFFQHNEVVEIPMQNAWQLELTEIFQFQLEGTRS